jgi:hypothetical protein
MTWDRDISWLGDLDECAAAEATACASRKSGIQRGSLGKPSAYPHTLSTLCVGQLWADDAHTYANDECVTAGPFHKSIQAPHRLFKPFWSIIHLSKNAYILAHFVLTKPHGRVSKAWLASQGIWLQLAGWGFFQYLSG